MNTAKARLLVVDDDARLRELNNARVNPFDICRRDLQVIGSFSSVNTCIVAQELLASKVIQVDHLVSHIALPWKNGTPGYRNREGPGPMHAGRGEDGVSRDF